jgi:phosphate/sulfate permease
VLKSEEMTIEIATLTEGVLIMIGAVIAGGAVYAGLQKLADALNKQK